MSGKNKSVKSAEFRRQAQLRRDVQACAGRCIRSAYFATGHPSTAVEAALSTWLEEVEELIPNFDRPSWAAKITDCEGLNAPTGGYSAEHTTALWQVAGFAHQLFDGRFPISRDVHAMILTISVKGAASDYAWIAFQDGDAIGWIETCTRMLCLVNNHPQRLTGLDPFSECGP